MSAVQGSFFDAPRDTLADARRVLAANLDDGARCPCCGQHAKIYKRKLNSGMARALVDIHIRGGGSGDYIHALKLLVAVGRFNADFPKLQHWGLLEAFRGEREDGSDRNGFYRITPAGVDFVTGRSRVMRYAKIYNDELLGLEGEEIGIQDALGDKFNYSELMTGPLSSTMRAEP